MRGFIVLCLSAVALAAPQGYNYNPGAGTGGFSAPAVSSGSAQSSSFSVGGYNGGATIGPAAPGGFFQTGAGNGYTNHGGVSSHQQTQQHHQQQHQQQQQQQQTIVTKRFFIHLAPEDNDEDYKERHITVGVPKKNYNVVFIKSPSKSSKKTTLKISPAPNEEKTVVYVLTKKTDAHDVHTEVLEQPHVTSKPEVFFIKYNTNEEAAHAQEQIQSQYDALGGSSQVTDEGYAPVSSVIGSLGGNTASAGSTATSSTSTGYASSASGSRGSNNAYLPPSTKSS